MAENKDNTEKADEVANENEDERGAKNKTQERG